MKVHSLLNKKIKITSLIIVVFFLSGYMVINAESTTKLPVTEILGKEYYVYEVKKGESIYGISKKNGWDLEELLRLNPEAGNSLSKGTRIYYPTGHVAVVSEMNQPVEIDYSELEPIRHKVKKGETIYSISRQYGIPLDVIYKYHPSAKKGVQTGELIELPQTGNSKFYYYTVKSGDTLSSIAKRFNTSVEDILKDNAGLTVSNLKQGETIRLQINSNVGKIKTEMVEEERVAQISGYKVNKNESWDEISEKTGVEVEVLKEANNTDEKPKENTIVHVPVVETVEVEKTVTFEEQKDLTVEEVQELYDSIKGTTPDERIFEGVRMALILDEPNSKKDIDFTRGVLVALQQMKDSPYKIDLKVIDGRVSTSNLTDELDYFEPNLIVSTADKAFPLFLADYGNTNNVQIVNVFDLKNDLYEDNASMVQMLPPSAYFNDRIATHLYKDNRRRKLIAVGEIDENDGIASELFKLYDGQGENISLEEFGNFEPELTETYLIYSYAGKKEEVSDFMNNVDNLAENYPGVDFKIAGRLSWAALPDEFGDKFAEYSVIIPSRVWLEEDSSKWKSFSSDYEEMFGGAPVRSIPNFAASGYDIAEYFIPAVARTKGDFNQGLMPSGEETLQNDINLTRVNNWGGFINGVGYLIHFKPDGRIEKIIVSEN